MPYILKTDNLETNSNKVTIIDSNGTDEQYPSAKAVYTALADFTPSSDDIDLSSKMDKFGSVNPVDDVTTIVETSPDFTLKSAYSNWEWHLANGASFSALGDISFSCDGKMSLYGTNGVDLKNTTLFVNSPESDSEATNRGWVNTQLGTKMNNFGTVNVNTTSKETTLRFIPGANDAVYINNAQLINMAASNELMLSGDSTAITVNKDNVYLLSSDETKSGVPLKGVATPSENSDANDAANKEYVDTKFSELTNIKTYSTTEEIPEDLPEGTIVFIHE